jgi:hypothetical protein
MVCGEHKPQTDFYKLAPTKRAKKDILGIGRLSRCRHCEISKYLNMDPRLKLLYAARSRAKKNGLDCTITVDDIVIPELCPALGIKLEARIGAGRSNREHLGNSPSLESTPLPTTPHHHDHHLHLGHRQPRTHHG